MHTCLAWQTFAKELCDRMGVTAYVLLGLSGPHSDASQALGVYSAWNGDLTDTEPMTAPMISIFLLGELVGAYDPDKPKLLTTPITHLQDYPTLHRMGGACLKHWFVVVQSDVPGIRDRLFAVLILYNGLRHKLEVKVTITESGACLQLDCEDPQDLLEFLTNGLGEQGVACSSSAEAEILELRDADEVVVTVRIVMPQPTMEHAYVA